MRTIGRATTAGRAHATVRKYSTWADAPRSTRSDGHRYHPPQWCLATLPEWHAILSAWFARRPDDARGPRLVAPHHTGCPACYGRACAIWYSWGRTAALHVRYSSHADAAISSGPT